jgi:hypothetical protein
VKEEPNKNMESLKKKVSNRNPGNNSSLCQIKNTVKCHFSRLEQVEDRISGLERKMDIKEKEKNS